MRYGMRLGRGTWVTGGGGVLAASLFFSVLHAMLLVSIFVARTVFVGGVWLALHAHRVHRASRERNHLRSTRIVQLEASLRGSINIAAASAASRGTKVWAVYVVGSDFHHGRYPTKANDLLQLYPDFVDEIAQVALFPDAGRARSAAIAMQRMSFSHQELLSLFPENYLPRKASVAVEPGESQAALPQAEASAPSIQTKETFMNTGRDRTQYTFDGQSTGKGRLVLALVKRYASDNPGASFEDVRAAFPDALQADSPIQFSSVRAVVARLEDVPATARRRFHVDPEDRVRLSDCMAVVSREWNATNIKNVLGRAEQLGYIVAVAPKGQ